jgi:hypothetical protein
MAQRYLGIGHEQWQALPWHIRRTYINGMEADESVPIDTATQAAVTFSDGESPAMAGLPDGVQARRAGVPATPGAADVIDITAMISGFAPASEHGRR